MTFSPPNSMPTRGSLAAVLAHRVAIYWPLDRAKKGESAYNGRSFFAPKGGGRPMRLARLDSSAAGLADRLAVLTRIWGRDQHRETNRGSSVGEATPPAHWPPGFWPPRATWIAA